MSSPTYILGIDPSSPANAADTCAAAFAQQADRLSFREAVHGAGDLQIMDLVTSLGKEGRVVVGIDAPLSYNAGGGDRLSDKELRRLVITKGSRVGVMTPTMTRMVYLTLRGVALTRMLESLRPQVDVALVEVHPGACMALRGAPLQDVQAFKREPAARLRLLEWLEAQRVGGVPRLEDLSDHFVAACAAALAAWQWSLGRAVWCHPAQPPEHPYDFAC